jgi:hypothetical protein
MKTRVTHNGSAITMTEFEVREIDEHGDAQDVNHYNDASSALIAAQRLISTGVAAVVVERHTSRHPAHLFGTPDTYALIARFGNRSALKAWGA